MDYVEGQNLQETLDQHLQQHGTPLPEKPVLIWVDQVLDALTYLHSHLPHPVIHRDIKPSNIILMANGQVALVDFGLVKLLDPADPRTSSSMQGMGTLPYSPMEQIGGAGHTDARSDLYALGATLYYLLTGVLPADAPQRSTEPCQPGRAATIGAGALPGHRSRGAEGDGVATPTSGSRRRRRCARR